MLSKPKKIWENKTYNLPDSMTEIVDQYSINFRNFNSETDIYIMLGVTRTGKSSASMGLCGIPLQSFKEEGTGDFKVEIANDDPLLADIIGHKVQSCTIVPNIFKSKEKLPDGKPKYCIIDFPGEGDARGC